MKQKLFLIGIGTAAFIFASVGVSVIQMIVGALLPKTGPDPAGKMDPTPLEKTRAEYQQLVKEGKQPALTKTETKAEPTQTQQQPEQSTEPEVQPEPQPVVRQVAPSPPPRGPGNFDAPEPYYSPPVQTGPGNM